MSMNRLLKLSIFAVVAAASFVGGIQASRDEMYSSSRIAGRAPEARSYGVQSGDGVGNNSAGVPIAGWASDSVGDGIGGIPNPHGKDPRVVDLPGSERR